jgi:hypothetical protein
MESGYKVSSQVIIPVHVHSIAFSFIVVYLNLKHPSVARALKLRCRLTLFSERHVKMLYKLSKQYIWPYVAVEWTAPLLGMWVFVSLKRSLLVCGYL